MNISLQNVDKVSALLTLKLEKADYQARVEKTLKTYRQKANIPVSYTHLYALILYILEYYSSLCRPIYICLLYTSCNFGIKGPRFTARRRE